MFSFGSQLYKNLNETEHHDLLVLTILTQKFKQILNSKYHVEFSRYLNVKSSHAKHLGNESAVCDWAKQHNSSHYSKIANNFTSCQREIKERCNNYTNEAIKSFCTDLTASGRRNDEGDRTLLNDTFNKQLVFSEHFNLFDFITSMSRDDEKNVSNQDHKFDFIVLDFKSILNATTDSIAAWKPLMILEQDVIDKNIFTMHRALSEHDAFDESWMMVPSLWKCGTVCWGIIAAIVLIVLSLIFIISLSAGIATR